MGLNGSNRVWQYNKQGSKHDLINGMTNLNKTNYGVGYTGHIITAPSSGLNRTNS